MQSRARTAIVLATLGLILGACVDDKGDETEQRFALCDNGVLDPGEECDDGNRDDFDACLSSCLRPTCGDEFVFVGTEECDGRNLNSVTGAFNDPFTCSDLGRDGGTLRCTADCRLDLSDCGPAFTPTPTATGTPTGMVTATATITATPTPTRNPMCGNLTVEPGETCDDGNASNDDPCPSDCEILPCTPVPATPRAVQVDLASPPFQDASSITLLITYPDGFVSLPGMGNDASVAGRITMRQSGVTVTPNDFDHALRVVYTRPGRINPGRVFVLGFDECAGTTSPELAAFSCQVTACANSNGAIDGCTCSLSEVTP
jgi:cysteine-rich repeat protein